MYSVLICVILNVKIFCTLNSLVLAPPFVSHFQSPLCRLIFLSHVELGNLFLSLLTTSSNHSIHPPSLPQGTGSRWISLGAKYTVCACWSLCHMSWWCHFLKSVYYFCVSGEMGRGYLPLRPYCMWWLALFLFCFFCASWLNDSCAVPLTFSSLLFVFSLPLFLRVFVPFLEQISMPVCSSLA